MLQRLQGLVVLGLLGVSIPAAAVEPEAVDLGESGEKPAAQPAPSAEEAPSAKVTPPPAPSATEAAAASAPTGAAEHAAMPPPAAEEESSAAPTKNGWQLEAHGYFRAPLIMGLSSRPDVDNQSGPLRTQISYGPNRIADWSYYSFGYTRLQEQDWAELFVHVKKKHVDAALGIMGYWFQGVGVRNPDASQFPGLGYLTLDTDIDVGDIKPNVALTMGAFWPKYGYFAKYDTYTLGRFHQMGEEVNLTIPFTPDLKVVATEGFGAGRDGFFNGYSVGGAAPIYGTLINLDLIAWVNLRLMYKKLADVSLHYNTSWTADPTNSPGTLPDVKSYGQVDRAHLTVLGAEFNLRAPYAGHLWLSPSYIHVRNGWALNQGGNEVMHSLGGGGLSGMYLFYGNNPSDSTGTGSLTNVGFMYENSLSSIQGKEFGTVLPDVTLAFFGLYMKSKADLPPTTTFTRTSLKELKYGVEATLQATNWFGFMLRYDLVNIDMDNSGWIFSGVTPRIILSSHFLSSERIYLQYTRYTYGDNMKLNQSFPWGTQVAAGSNIFQAGYLAGRTPDRNVLKLQAEIAF